MKVRNGFVSNSSSSSFILSYNKKGVLTNPKDIVEYVKKYPEKSIIFNCGEWNEGDDIFELDEEQKSLIRKFPLEFIKCNTGTKSVIDYNYEPDDITDHVHLVEKDIPKVTAYTDGVILRECGSEYRDFDVDMSDVESVELPDDYFNRREEPEIKELLNKSDNWYRIQEEREKVARRKFEKDLMEEYKQDLISNYKVNPEDAVSELVDVSNGSCDPDRAYISDFVERYLTNEYYDEYFDENQGFYHIKKKDRKEPKSFAIYYSESLTDKNEISDFITNRLSSSNGKNYLLWTNPVYNSLYDGDEQMYDFYEIGPKEAEIFIDNKENFFKNDREVVLFTNSEIQIDGGTIPENSGKNVSLGYGKIVVISADSDTRDFKKNVGEGEREW